MTMSRSKSQTENKKVYIAGPMSGLPNNNFAEFDRAAELLKARGLEPMNPAEIGRQWLIDNSHREPNPSEYQQILNEDRKMLRACASIFLLRGWEKSKGALSELSYALILGLGVELEAGQ